MAEPADRVARHFVLTKDSLHDCAESAFMKMWESGSESSLMLWTGFDRKSIEYMLGVPSVDGDEGDEAFKEPKFQQLYNRYCIHPRRDGVHEVLKRTSEKRELSALQCLCLVLTWTRTRGATFPLAALFGLPTTSCYKYLRFGRKVLLRVLSVDGKAIVKAPTRPEIAEFKAAVQAKYPDLQDVCLVADGLKIPVDCPGDPDMQSRFYNGWTNSHYVSNVFVFAPNGKIVICAGNFPGAAHDSLVARWGGVYSELKELYERDGVRCAVDSAFCQGEFPFLVKSGQGSAARTDSERRMASQATKLRQASEWGMRGLKGSFPRLLDGLDRETIRERKLRLYLFILLFNLRAELVHINQIQTVFMPSVQHSSAK